MVENPSWLKGRVFGLNLVFYKSNSGYDGCSAFLEIKRMRGWMSKEENRGWNKKKKLWLMERKNEKFCVMSSKIL